jgi:hypothetical protein
MGIVLGKPENYRKISTSAVRRIANEEINANERRSTRRNNRRNNKKKEEEEMPEEFKAAMREAELDPEDSDDVKKFMNMLNQDGGRRKRQTKNKRRS